MARCCTMALRIVPMGDRLSYMAQYGTWSGVAKAPHRIFTVNCLREFRDEYLIDTRVIVDRGDNVAVHELKIM